MGDADTADREVLSEPSFVYRAKFIKNYDGDTVTLLVDVGFNVFRRINVRVRGVDTAEMRGGTESTKALARDAKGFTAAFLEGAESIIVRTAKDPKRSFTRWVGDIFADGESLAEALIAAKKGIRIEG